MYTPEAINLIKEIKALTNDITADIKARANDGNTRWLEGLEGNELNEEVEVLFNETYEMARAIDFLIRKEGMNYVKEEINGQFVSLYYKVTPKALLSLNDIFSKYRRHTYFYEKKYDRILIDGEDGNGDYLFIITFVLTEGDQNSIYKALTTNSYPYYLRPYKVILEKRVRLDELLTAVGGQSYLMDKLLGKNKRHSRSRKVRHSRSRKVRHSRFRKVRKMRH